jgi:hypothetical protein
LFDVSGRARTTNLETKREFAPYHAKRSHSPGLPGEWLSKQNEGSKRAVIPLLWH